MSVGLFVFVSMFLFLETQYLQVFVVSQVTIR